MIFCVLVLALLVVASDALRVTHIAKNSMKFSRQWMVNTQQEISAEEAEFVDNALVQRVEAEVFELTGVGLDGLMNPSTVLNLERDLIDLEKKLAIEIDESSRKEIQAKIDKKTAKLFTEKRTVMRGWLKNLFVGQSVLAAAVSLGMSYNALPGQDLPLPLQVLGFWMWWLFIIPSLRARKPSNAEKDALNIAFLATPVVSLVGPAFTKDTGALWWANLAAVVACYGYSFLKVQEGDDVDDEEKSSLPPLLVKAMNALDYGSGRERGLRK